MNKPFNLEQARLGIPVEELFLGEWISCRFSTIEFKRGHIQKHLSGVEVFCNNIFIHANKVISNLRMK